MFNAAPAALGGSWSVDGHRGCPPPYAAPASLLQQGPVKDGRRRCGKDSAGDAPQDATPRVRSSDKASGLPSLQLARAFAPGQQAHGEAPAERAGPGAETSLGRTNTLRFPMLRQLQLRAQVRPPGGFSSGV
ncbi:hypothetical protein NDU88_003083 [Pleurodeles waltl]|uniref:Uncharacterized protein n=1 Tax=Pleurodeles waltl TaxID=8319 RepID=A0AAV7RHF4_PLEWA|nr:hypothetical protein NDU88_003083 [Pleurodeles waltl]